ncbi:MAG: mismatch-specific DNA-glycosylase, partial [Sporomusa sp.]
MDHVPDIIALNLRILFIGFNPGLRSAETGHHFAGHSNKFWKLLAAAGLTPYQFKPDEDGKLLALGLGITNIVARPSRAASEITREEYLAGREVLQN